MHHETPEDSAVSGDAPDFFHVPGIQIKSNGHKCNILNNQTPIDIRNDPRYSNAPARCVILVVFVFVGVVVFVVFVVFVDFVGFVGFVVLCVLCCFVVLLLFCFGVVFWCWLFFDELFCCLLFVVCCCCGSTPPLLFLFFFFFSSSSFNTEKQWQNEQKMKVVHYPPP